MFKYEVKLCPRCTRAFKCKPGKIEDCECSQVSLKPEQIAFIEEQYSECLCKQCLFLLKQEYEIHTQNEQALKAVANQAAQFFFR
jgi:hypothetical protein